MRAYQFAKKNNFSVETCRRYGIHAQTARLVEQTFEQILSVAQSLKSKVQSPDSASDSSQLPSPGSQPAASEPDPGIQLPETCSPSSPPPDPLPRCLMAGFVDQLCVRRDLGTLECELTEGRRGSLMRESVVQNAKLFVAATIREVTGRGSENLTLLGLATAVKREWLQETFPNQVSSQIEHLYDRTHKRVAAVKLVRFRDLVMAHEHQREVDPECAGRCLAEASQKQYFELPLFNHELKQLIARVNLVAATMPDLEFKPFDEAAITTCLAHAFHGLTLAKDAQAAPLREAFVRFVAKDRLAWLDELAPLSVLWPDGRKLKLLYQENALDDDGQPNPPELQVKLHECFVLKEHPHICEGHLPVKLWLCAPDGKRLEPTFNWPAFKANSYPKSRPALQKKYPGVTWL